MNRTERDTGTRKPGDVRGRHDGHGGHDDGGTSGTAGTGGGSRIATLRADISAATSTIDACQVTANAIAEPGRAAVSVLLQADGELHGYAVAGSWRAYYAPPPDAGAMGTAFRTGQECIDDPIDPADSPYPVTPLARLVLCIPVLGRDHPVGVLKLELPDRLGLDTLRATARTAAELLGKRLLEIGYSGRETPAEQLVRYAFRIVTAATERGVVDETLRAAREITGMNTAVGIRERPGDEPLLVSDPNQQTALSRRLAALTPEQLGEINSTTQRYGSWYTVGPPEGALAPAPRSLLDIGARSVIAVPVGRGIARIQYRRILLVIDEAERRPHPSAIGLLQLLGAQAAVSLERIWLLDSLKEQAGRDPLTGLGHQATLGERMTHTTPGHTAVLLLDIDRFKEINDTRGHAAGDRVLVDLASTLSKALRPQDELFRVGGDEFVALLEVNSLAQARRIGKRLLAAARQAGCTISVGVSLQAEEEPAEHALRRADTAMYVAKREGRDRLRLAAELGESRVPGMPPGAGTGAAEKFRERLKESAGRHPPG